ncbi:hypothetical protein QBC43DRAFT_25586 [Cladorrhinum sp. PSN259]|nr:hypothetical protein QBC43DRAFT_25586 [Cladorrhinum sp. PSN259]
MGNRPFCWKVNLIFACGCSEETDTNHLCGPDREDCNAWLTNRKTNKKCIHHRGAAGLYSEEANYETEEDTTLKVEERGPTQQTVTTRKVVSWEAQLEQRGTWEGYYLKKRSA